MYSEKLTAKNGNVANLIHLSAEFIVYPLQLRKEHCFFSPFWCLIAFEYASFKLRAVWFSVLSTRTSRVQN